MSQRRIGSMSGLTLAGKSRAPPPRGGHGVLVGFGHRASGARETGPGALDLAWSVISRSAQCFLGWREHFVGAEPALLFDFLSWGGGEVSALGARTGTIDVGPIEMQQWVDFPLDATERRPHRI